MWFTRVSIQNPVFATMVMAALCVLGLFSYSQLRVERLPDITPPIVFVSVAYPGASPEATETELTRPIELSLNGIAGVKMIRSNSLEGRSETVVEFQLSADMNRAVQDVRDKVATVQPSFPRDAKQPYVSRFDGDNAQPTVYLSLLSKDRSARGVRPMSAHTTRAREGAAAPIRKSDHHRVPGLRSVRAANRSRHRPSRRAARGGSDFSGAPLSSCVQMSHSLARPVLHGVVLSPRRSGRRSERSTGSSLPFTSLRRNTNASLQPHFTPSCGGPNGLSASGWPARTRRSNAARTAGGIMSHGLAGSSRASRDGWISQRSTSRPRCTAAAMHGIGRNGSAPGKAARRATSSDGYTAASNAAGDSDQSSSATTCARSPIRRRMPPPASDPQSFAGRSKAIVPPARRSASERSVKSAAMSTWAAKPGPARASEAPRSHAASDPSSSTQLLEAEQQPVVLVDRMNARAILCIHALG